MSWKSWLLSAVVGILAGILLWLCTYYFPAQSAFVGITLGAILGVSLMLGLPGYYVFLKMVDANIFWTRVEQGWRRIILKWGKHHKTIGPGLHLIGIPGMHTLYKRTMTFFKSTTSQEGKPQAEPHKDPDISQFKTTDYPYAFPYKDEEDSKGLHMYGIMAVMAVIVNYWKAFFRASDWYAIMNTLIMPCFRQALSTVSYTQIIGGKEGKAKKKAEKELKKTISQRLWKAMNEPGEDENGQPLPSVVEKLHKLYGIKVKSVELRSIDPPPDWRDITLAPFKAQKEKEAAAHQAETSAILFDDTNQALQAWLKCQRDAGFKPTRAEIAAKQEELRARALAKTGSYHHFHGLEGATTAVIGGANAGIMIGSQGGKGNSGNPGGSPDDDILSRDPATMSDEDFKRYTAAVRRRKSRG